jgi:hypothetical protein
MSAKVTIKAAADSAQLDELTSRLLIGRLPDAGLTIDDPTVSRRHAEIFVHGDQTFVRDLGSSNGTWVNGRAIAGEPQLLTGGDQLYVGQVPVQVAWQGGNDNGSTRYEGSMPDIIRQAMELRQQKMERGELNVPAPTAAPAAPSKAAGIEVGASSIPRPEDFPYRRQGSNGNGVLLIATRKESYTNGDILDGYVEFTSLDNETIASITVELVEVHKRGPRNGHVWDRVLVRQGPWKSAKNDVLPLPFQLRVPGGTSATGPVCHWEIRGYVDIAWASDVGCNMPINMRNSDVERLRDALGALDFRVTELEAEPLGQEYRGLFQPAPHMIKEIGITDIHLHIQYLGTTIKTTMTVEKSSLFKFDRKAETVFDLAKLRQASQAEVVSHFRGAIDALMAK